MSLPIFIHLEVPRMLAKVVYRLIESIMTGEVGDDPEKDDIYLIQSDGSDVDIKINNDIIGTYPSNKVEGILVNWILNHHEYPNIWKQEKGKISKYSLSYGSIRKIYYHLKNN